MTLRRRSVITLGALAVAAAATGARGAAAGPPPGDPCLQAQLRCPDLVMRPAGDLHLVARPGGELLAATSALVNIGAGPLELRARRDGPRTMVARQVLRAQPGSSAVVAPGAGELYFVHVRGRGSYWKYEDAARFELWAEDGVGRLVGLVRTGPKVFYCLRDLRRVRTLAATPRARVFPACSQAGARSQVTLGTSPGWADIYPSTYPRNWIDVTGLSGCFAYVLVADPGQHLWESREDDNASAVSVRLPWRGAGGCPSPAPAQAARRGALGLVQLPRAPLLKASLRRGLGRRRSALTG
jgi:hypothetical protein